LKDPKFYSSRDRFATVFRDGRDRRIRYRPLEVGDPVNPDQMVALMDPTLALNQLAGKLAKLDAARADHKAAIELDKVDAGEVSRLDEIRRRDPRGVADSEYAVAKAQRDKYKFEALSKAEAINVARNEAVEAETVVDFHYLRNPIRLPDDGRPGDPPTIFV